MYHNALYFDIYSREDYDYFFFLQIKIIVYLTQQLLYNDYFCTISLNFYYRFDAIIAQTFGLVFLKGYKL